MLNSMTSDSFQIDKTGADLISIKVKGFGNSIVVPARKIDELIQMLHKTENEFYPSVARR